MFTAALLIKHYTGMVKEINEGAYIQKNIMCLLKIVWRNI